MIKTTTKQLIKPIQIQHLHLKLSHWKIRKLAQSSIKLALMTRPNCAGANATKTTPLWQSREGTEVLPKVHKKLSQNCHPLQPFQPVDSQAHESGTKCSIQDKMYRSRNTPVQKDRQLCCYTFFDLKYSQNLEQNGK